MSVLYTIDTQITLSKASVANDPKALEALRTIESAYEPDMDSVELFDLDHEACDLQVQFHCPERSHTNADQISDFIDRMTPHAMEPFQVRGENDEGEFVDVQGDHEHIIDEAIKVGERAASEALPDQKLNDRLEKAMRYASEEKSDAVSTLLLMIRCEQEEIPESLMKMLEHPMSTLEKND